MGRTESRFRVEVNLESLGLELREIVREEVLAAIASRPGSSPWLSVEGAAAYLAASEDAVRALVRRQQIPFSKAPNGRLLFDRAELNEWVRGSRNESTSSGSTGLALVPEP